MQSSFEGKTKHLAPRIFTDNVLKEFSLKKHIDSPPVHSCLLNILEKSFWTHFFRLWVSVVSQGSFTKGQLCSDLLAARKDNLQAPSLFKSNKRCWQSGVQTLSWPTRLLVQRPCGTVGHHKKTN